MVIQSRLVWVTPSSQGTYIAWRCTKSPHQGVEEVTVDGTAYTVDTTLPDGSESSGVQVVFEVDLNDGQHVIQVKKTSAQTQATVIS